MWGRLVLVGVGERVMVKVVVIIVIKLWSHRGEIQGWARLTKVERRQGTVTFEFFIIVNSLLHSWS